MEEIDRKKLNDYGFRYSRSLDCFFEKSLIFKEATNE